MNTSLLTQKELVDKLKVTIQECINNYSVVDAPELWEILKKRSEKVLQKILPKSCR